MAEVIIEGDHLKNWGMLLSREGLGGTIRMDEGKNVLYYLQLPSSAYFAFAESGVVVPYDSNFLRCFIELACLRLGQRTKWTCKKKGEGRLNAKCSRAGIGASSRSNGIRNRVSNKVNCPAFVNASKLETSRDGTVVLKKLLEQLEGKDGKGPEFEEVHDENGFCVITSMSLTHKYHLVEPSSGAKIVLQRSKDILADDAIMKRLNEFLSICTSRRGRSTKALEFLATAFPGVHIPVETLRNVLLALQENEDDARDFVSLLRKKKLSGDVEYCYIDLDDNTGTLKAAIWAFSGARSLVDRCGDILFWDSTHNTTRYDYKLSTFNIVDSEEVTRSVLIGISISEAAEDHKRMLVSWHEAFRTKLPPVIVTDGDVAIYAALKSVPYSEELCHILCTFHLFDLDVKDRVKPLFAQNGCGSVWIAFKKGLNLCREASTEEELERLWNGLLDEYFPPVSRYTAVRKYLLLHVWGKRKQWATAFFREKFTLGHSSTQRAESWHDILKNYSVKNSSLIQLFRSLQKLVTLQGNQELKSRDNAHRLAPLRNVTVFTGSPLLDQISERGLSRAASKLLQIEMEMAQRLTVSIAHGGVFKASESCNPVESFKAVSRSPSVDGEDNTDESRTSGLLTRSSRSIVGHTKYTYAMEGEHKWVTTCELNIAELLSNLESGQVSAPPSQHQYNNLFKCDCCYVARVNLPCRHLLALVMHIDKYMSQQYIDVLTETQFDSMLQLLITLGCRPRWCGPFEMNCQPLETAGGESLKNDSNLILNWAEKDESWNSWFGVRAGGMESSLRKSILTKLPEKDKGYLAYSVLLGSLRCLCDLTTNRNELMDFGIVLFHFSNALRSELEFNRYSKGTKAGISASVLEDLMTSTLKASISEWKYSRNAAIDPMIPDSSNSEGQLGRGADVGSFGKLSAAIDPVETETPAEPPDETHGLERNLTVNFNTVEHKPERVQNPPKRRDARKQSKASLVIHKTRGSRRKRKDQSRRTPAQFRMASPLKPSIPPKPSIYGYACPKCNEIRVQNNPANVRQHFISKHSSEHIPTIEQMIQAANVRLEGKKAGSEPSSPNRESPKSPQRPQSNAESVEEIDAEATQDGTVTEREKISNISNYTPPWKRLMSPNVTRPNDISSLKSGCRIEMFWKQDLRWYRGTVKSIENLSNNSGKEPAVRLSICYDDGDFEELRDLSKHKWRQVFTGNSFPRFCWEEDTAISEYHQQSIRKARLTNDSGKDKRITPKKHIDIFAYDYLTLEPNTWIDDMIIFTFSRALLQRCSNDEDHRILLIDPQISQAFEDRANGKDKIRSWLNGLDLHEVDILLWPLHHSVHWCLCVADVSQRNLYLFDPYHPYNFERVRTTLRAKVLEIITLMSESYCTRYRDSRKWKFVTTERLAAQKNLPIQPPGNTTDCGVIVCIYLWSFITGQSIPGGRIRRRDFGQLMRNTRSNIGARVCMFGDVKLNSST